MKGELLSQLGQVLLSSLWQGAIFGAVLMVLLWFVRQARWRYILACLTLFAMLIWFAVSAVNVFVPARDFTIAQTTVTQNTNAPTPEIPTESAATATKQSSDVMPNVEVSAQSRVTPTLATRATKLTFPRFNLENFLPYISLLWMLGAAVLSLRLLISVYLLKRYRKESFELSETWVQGRLQSLAQRMKLVQRVKLLQTNTLTTPAVMGVVKPLLLIPSSLVSGLSVQQLDMLLAHELAHIKRQDYFVNILQTLAETLLFYHPVVWWVSKIIRQEREHCCDDMVLQVTGQSALEYADVLLRLEHSRQALALAANSGSLLRRVERLLNPPKAGVSVGSSLATLLLVVCLSLTLTVNAVSAQPVQVSKVPYVFNTAIAIDPTDPNRIAITVDKTEEIECEYDCRSTALLYISNDAGKTWQEHLPYGEKIETNSLRLAFDDRGSLYTSTEDGFFDDFKSSAYVSRANEDMRVIQDNMTRLEDKKYESTKITAQPETNTLYLSYLSYEDVGLYSWFLVGIPELRTSTDGGETWSEPLRVVEKSIWETNGGFPIDVNVLLGEDKNLAVVWTQIDDLLVKDSPDMQLAIATNIFPYSVWIVSSEDSGQTFSMPRKVDLGKSWGGISTASGNGNYYVLTKQASEGKLGLDLSYTDDSGRDWTRINGDVQLYSNFPVEVTPGMSVAPDGTIDIVFYGHVNAPDCISVPSPTSTRWVDKCSYNVYYTFSKDGGKSFLSPQKLNEEPIVGSQFVQFYGWTIPGSQIGIASSNEAAYPVWIGNRAGVEGTQAYMMKIER